MKIVSVPKKEQTTYYCDKCKKILDKRWDHIQKKVFYKMSFLRSCTYSEEMDIVTKIIRREDLCDKCYMKKRKKYDKFVKLLIKREKRKHKIIRFLSFSGPFISINAKVGRIVIKWKYTKCRCGLCLRNGKDNIIMRNGETFYYCDKCHKMIIDLLIRNCIIRTNGIRIDKYYKIILNK